MVLFEATLVSSHSYPKCVHARPKQLCTDILDIFRKVYKSVERSLQCTKSIAPEGSYLFSL